MTISEVHGLRGQNRVTEAYEAARQVYSVDKSPAASEMMFGAAVDMLKLNVAEGRMDEARRIGLALQRLFLRMDEQREDMREALAACQELLSVEKEKETSEDDVPNHLKMGAWGENLAAAYLRDKGYVVMERDWHSGHRDIDIIARQNECVVFVEVKTRRDDYFIQPEQAVNYQKLKNLQRSINHYLKYRRIDNPWRFDIISIIGDKDDMTPKIHHMENVPLY